MIIKWHKNFLYYKKRKIEFEREIIKADVFEKWTVVALPHKLYFLGKDEYVMPFPILAIDIRKDQLVYQNREDRNIYKITHPYDKEKLIFYSPFYNLKFIWENEIFVLEKDKRIILKYREKYFNLALTNSESSLEYKILECSNSEFQEAFDDSLDLKITNFSFDRIFEIYLYGKFLLLIYENTLTFLKFENGNFTIGTPICLNEKITTIKNIKMDLEGKNVELLQINNSLFYQDICIVRFPKNEYIKPDKYSRNYYKLFWNKPDSLEKKILGTLEIEKILSIIKEGILQSCYNFTRYGIERSKLDFVLELEFIKSRNCLEFLEKIKKYDFLENSSFFDKINRLVSSDQKILENPSFREILSINYRRIFFFNENFITDQKFDNLAYTLIYYEKNKNAIFREIRKLNLNSFFKKYYGDDRMFEVIRLFYEPVRHFELDENNVEDIKERNYVLRISANIGKAFCFYNNNFFLEQNKLDLSDLNEELIFPLVKNAVTTKIELKDKTWKNWPSFNFGCYKILSTKKDHSIKMILAMPSTDEFLISGMIYGLGLKNKLKRYDFDNLVGSIEEEREIILISLIIAYGSSNKNIRNSEFEEFCFKKIFSDQSFDLKIGAFVGLSHIFTATKNLKMQNMLKIEINRSGVFKSDKYNKNNLIVYDKTYKIISTFNLARVICENQEFIQLESRLCEILLNGICLKNKSKHIRKFERFKGDPLDEIFYSGLFLEEFEESKIKKNVLMPKVENLKINEQDTKTKRFEERISEIEKGFEKFTIWDVYRYAGIIFYYGITISIELTESHINLLLKIESEMLKNDGFRVLFDYILISYCLFSKSNCNLEVLKIVRRQIKRTENSTERINSNNYVFTNSGIKKDIVNGLTFGDIEKYKICLGILCLGLSKYEIEKTKFTKFALISTFYVNWPTAPYEQDYFNFFRYEIFQTLKKKDKLAYKKYFLTKHFKYEFSKLTDKEKKYVIDVLSDYYENYHSETDYAIDIDYLKDLVIRST